MQTHGSAGLRPRRGVAGRDFVASARCRSNSGQNCLDALLRRGVDAHPVDGMPALLADIAAKRCDRVFNIMHGGGGENGVVQGLLDALHVPVHRLGRARLGVDARQDPHEAGLAVAQHADAALRAAVAHRRCHRRGALARLAGDREARVRRLERRRESRLQGSRSAAGGRARRALRRRVADGAADRRRGIHRRHPARRSAADDPHRAGRRVLRLPREVRRRRHAVHLPGPARHGGDGDARARARSIPHGRVQRLGSRRS